MGQRECSSAVRNASSSANDGSESAGPSVRVLDRLQNNTACSSVLLNVFIAVVIGIATRVPVLGRPGG